MIGAADTFRAAAVEQLERWGERAGVDVVKGPEGSDPGAVAFDAIARGRERGADVVIIDTAGRLHTQHDLMEELTKVRRVITKQMPDAPHETLMTVDATTGQNGVRQAKLFGEAVGVTGIVLTKLDGTAKGGIALAIANELGHPGQADRDRRAARGPAAVRRRRLRPGAAHGVTCTSAAPDTIGSMESWVLWLIAAVVFAVGEIATLGFFLAPFAGGAAVAALLAAAGAGATVECGRVPGRLDRRCCAALRPLARSHQQAQAALKTGTAALVGQTAMVVERIANDEGVGCVQARRRDLDRARLRRGRRHRAGHAGARDRDPGRHGARQRE